MFEMHCSGLTVTPLLLRQAKLLGELTTWYRASSCSLDWKVTAAGKCTSHFSCIWSASCQKRNRAIDSFSGVLSIFYRVVHFKCVFKSSCLRGQNRCKPEVSTEEKKPDQWRIKRYDSRVLFQDLPLLNDLLCFLWDWTFKLSKHKLHPIQHRSEILNLAPFFVFF